MIQKNEAFDVLLDDLLARMEQGVAKSEFIEFSEVLTIPEMVHIMERCLAGEVKGYIGDAKGFGKTGRRFVIYMLNRRLSRGDIEEQELWKAFFKKLNSVICHRICEYDKIHHLLIKINRQKIVYRFGDPDDELKNLFDPFVEDYLVMVIKCVDRVINNKLDPVFLEFFPYGDEDFLLEALEKDAINKGQVDEVIEYSRSHHRRGVWKAIPALLLKKYGQWPDAQEDRAIKKKIFMVRNPVKKAPKEGEDE